MNQNTLPYIAQQALDRFYQTYRSDNSFFTVDDFIQYVGNAVGGYYQQVWDAKYKEIRSEKRDEVVTFDSGILSEQTLNVPHETSMKSSFTIPLASPIMSFMSDQNNCGLQMVLYSKTDCEDIDTRAIRTTLVQKNSITKLPICDRIFFYLDGNSLGIVNKRMLPIKQIKLYYVPSVNEDMVIPEGVRQSVIDMAVMSLKEAHKDVIVKRELGDNPNMIMESEIDKGQLV